MKRPMLMPRRMILTELFSDLGDQFVHLTLLAELFFGLAASHATLLLLCLIQQTPAILLGPLAGRWVDRIGPRNGIVGGILVRLLLVVGLLNARVGWGVWPIYLLFSGASLIFVIARLCITPRIVAPEELIGYNAVNERVALATGIGGPFLIGLLIQQAGAGVSLGMGIAMYGCGAWLAYGLPRVDAAAGRAGEKRPRGWWRRLRCAYLAPLTDPRIGIWSILSLVVGTVGSVLNFGAPVYNRTYFQGDIVAWGAVMSGFQAGACLATLLLPALERRMADRTLMASCFAMVGMGFILLAAFPRLPLFAMVMAGLGCLFTLLAMYLMSRIQRDCAETRRGGVLSALTALGGMCLLAGVSVGALVVRAGGVRPLLALGAVSSVVAALAACRFSRVSHAREGDGLKVDPFI